MAQFVGVSFRRQGQIYFFLATPFVLAMHDMVLVKTEEGIGFGEIVALRDEMPEGIDPETLKPIYRPATQEDMDIGRENQTLAKDAKKFCQQCVERLGLDMKLVEVEIYFDKSKMIFYFTSPGRVDFRELVKDLVRTYRTRIELRQIGVRHETQMIGALGNCGQVCCCRRYLRRFEPVTIKMAKDQNLFLNPAKISGVCGRLLCCLSYEKENYSDFQSRAPKIGRKFATTQGNMKTLRANMFRDSVSVLTEAGDELDFSLDDWNAIVLQDQSRPYVQEEAPEEVSAELEALVDPEFKEQNRSKERKTFPPQRRDQRPRPQGGERQERRDHPRPELRTDHPRPERPAVPAGEKFHPERPAGERHDIPRTDRPVHGTNPHPREAHRNRDKRRKSGPPRKDHPSGQGTPQ